MSDINLIIEEAADILSANERKSQGRKKSYTPEELQEMLILQENQKENNRTTLNQKLLILCKRAQEQFNLSSIPTGMMEQIAIDISTQVKEGNITSVENVEKNEMVIKSVQREATKAQIVENYESEMSGMPIPHETIPLYVEEIGYIASNPEVASAVSEYNEPTEMDRTIDEITKDVTIDNVEEVTERLQEVIKSQEYQDNLRNKTEINLAILESAREPEEFKMFCENAEAKEAMVKSQYAPQNKQYFANLLQNFVVRIYSENQYPQRIANDMRAALLSNSEMLTPEQRVQLDGMIKKYESEQVSEKLVDFLAEKITEFNKNVSKEEIIKVAKEEASGEVSPDRITKNSLKERAHVRLVETESYIKYCDLIDQVYALSENSTELNWEELENLKSKSPELYKLTLRVMNQRSKGLSDNSVFEQTQELIKEFATEEKDVSREDRFFICERESQNTNLKSAYWVLASNVMSNTANFESIKMARMENIRSSNLFTEEQKQEEIAKLEKISTTEEALEYALDGIEREYMQSGVVFDREKAKSDIIQRANDSSAKAQKRQERNDKRDIYAAKASVVLEQGEYERYIETLRNINKNRVADVDEELLDLLKQVDSELYEHLCNEYFVKCKNVRVIQDKSYKRMREIERAKKLKEKTHAESERPAEERTGIIKEDTEVAEETEKGVLQAENSVGDVIANVTDENTLMETANVKPKGKTQEDEEPEL